MKNSYLMEQIKTLDDSELNEVSGGGRTTESECRDAGMKWSKDKGTPSDGKGQCKP